MQSKAATVKQYLAELPPDRRAAIQAVREVILQNLDKTYEEGMQYGAIGYYVPHRVFPAGYHCDPRQPLPFAGLGSQKHHMALGIMCHYGDTGELDWFKKEWAKTGKKLDMGKCCIRFRKLEDLPLEVIGEAIRRVPADRYIAYYEALFADRLRRGGKPASASAGRIRPTAKRPSRSRAARPAPAARKKVKVR